MAVRQSLTEFELLVLLAVLRLGDDAYGVTITSEIEQTAGRTVLLSAVYTVLGRLEDTGFVTSRQGDPTPERGGKAKRYFAVTHRGVRAVKETRQALAAMWTGLPQLRAKKA